MSVRKPKHSSVRDPEKQENNRQYKTYYRNKYNRDKAKKKTFTDLILGMEQQIHNRKPRHKNFNNVITF